MTRMWCVPPHLMCDQHLLGEHKEMHQIVGTIRSHPHGEKIAKGHADEDQLNTEIIQVRHDNLVFMMERRGMVHDSPMNYDDDLGIGNVNPDDNIVELYERCEDCRERIQESTFEVDVLL